MYKLLSNDIFFDMCTPCPTYARPLPIMISILYNIYKHMYENAGRTSGGPVECPAADCVYMYTYIYVHTYNITSYICMHVAFLILECNNF
jgi:hypothetical protein